MTSRMQLILACAAAAHNVNRAWCKAHGDESQPTWTDAPEWQKTSAVMGVEGVLNGNSPRQSHECWLQQKEADGWKYGPVKNPEAKEHPCFVPYDELPPEQREKDHLFVETVRSVAHQVGLRPANPQRPKDWLEQFFGYKHLPPHLQAVSAPFCEQAERIVDTLPSNPERTVALRKLLESKDCAVRALLAGPMHREGPQPPSTPYPLPTAA